LQKVFARPAKNDRRASRVADHATKGLSQAGESFRRMSIGTYSGGIVTRAIRSHQLWLTVAYVTIMLLLARAYA
jgi:hypothetical protein